MNTKEFTRRYADQVLFIKLIEKEIEVVSSIANNMGGMGPHYRLGGINHNPLVACRKLKLLKKNCQRDLNLMITSYKMGLGRDYVISPKPRHFKAWVLFERWPKLNRLLVLRNYVAKYGLMKSMI